VGGGIGFFFVEWWGGGFEHLAWGCLGEDWLVGLFVV